MKLSDVVSGSGLAGYAVIALVIFLVVFGVITLRILFMKREQLDHVARLPLDDSEPSSSPKREREEQSDGR